MRPCQFFWQLFQSYVLYLSIDWLIDWFPSNDIASPADGRIRVENKSKCARRSLLGPGSRQHVECAVHSRAVNIQHVLACAAVPSISKAWSHAIQKSVHWHHWPRLQTSGLLRVKERGDLDSIRRSVHIFGRKKNRKHRIERRVERTLQLLPPDKEVQTAASRREECQHIPALMHEPIVIMRLGADESMLLLSALK